MYRIGRRFEYRVVYSLRKFGINAKRIPLSGRSSEFYPNADILLEINDKILLGQLKYSRKNYVVFSAKELEQLKENKLFFLCFGFFRTNPSFVVKCDEEPLKEKISRNLVISRNDKEKYIKIGDLKLKILTLEEFINLIYLLKENKNNV